MINKSHKMVKNIKSIILEINESSLICYNCKIINVYFLKWSYILFVGVIKIKILIISCIYEYIYTNILCIHFFQR